MQYGRTGIIKKVDALGRIQIPIELQMHWKGRTLSISSDKDEKIILIRYAEPDTELPAQCYLRDMDSLNKRLVIPVNIRKALNIKAGDRMEILYGDSPDCLILQIVEMECAVCHQKGKELFFIHKDFLCETCIDDIKSM